MPKSGSQRTSKRTHRLTAGAVSINNIPLFPFSINNIPGLFDYSARKCKCKKMNSYWARKMQVLILYSPGARISFLLGGATMERSEAQNPRIMSDSDGVVNKYRLGFGALCKHSSGVRVGTPEIFPFKPPDARLSCIVSTKTNYSLPC